MLALLEQLCSWWMMTIASRLRPFFDLHLKIEIFAKFLDPRHWNIRAEIPTYAEIRTYATAKIYEENFKILFTTETQPLH